MGRGPLGGRKKENCQNFAVEGAADADAVEDAVLSTQAPPTGRAPAPAAVSHGHSLPRTALGAVQPSLLESSKRLTATAGAGGW